MHNSFLKSIGSFIKQILAAAIGITIATSIPLLITYKRFNPTTPPIANNTILKLTLNGQVSPSYPQDNPKNLVTQYLGQEPVDTFISLPQIRQILEKAAKDPKIKGLHLNIGTLTGGYDNISTLRKIIQEFKKSEKPIIAYLEIGSHNELLIAIIADDIIMNPSGVLFWQGLSYESLYTKNLLNKLGINVDVYRSDEKKRGPSHAQQEMSAEEKKMLQDILDKKWDEITKEIASSDKITEDELNKMAEETPILTPKQAKEKGLVTLIGHQDIMRKLFSNHTKIENLNHIKHNDYPTNDNADKHKKEKIGIIHLNGAINQASETNILALLQQYEKDKNIKSIIITIDSGGGESIASGNIANAIEKNKKPVIALVRNAACSGALEIAVACKHIIASSPITIIGSIGAYLAIQRMKGLCDKLDINIETLKTHPHANIFNRFHNSTEKIKLLTAQLKKKETELRKQERLNDDKEKETALRKQERLNDEEDKNKLNDKEKDTLRTEIDTLKKELTLLQSEKTMLDEFAKYTGETFKEYVKKQRDLSNKEINKIYGGNIFLVQDFDVKKLTDTIVTEEDSLKEAIRVACEKADIKDPKNIKLVYPTNQKEKMNKIITLLQNMLLSSILQGKNAEILLKKLLSTYTKQKSKKEAHLPSTP